MSNNENDDEVKQIVNEDIKNKPEEDEGEKFRQEWWDRNWIWHNRSPYVTPALMDKLTPFVKKLEKTAAWHAYHKYYKSISTPMEVPSLEEKWRIAKEWHEREDPEAFWNKIYNQHEEAENLRTEKVKRKLRRVKEEIKKYMHEE